MRRPQIATGNKPIVDVYGERSSQQVLHRGHLRVRVNRTRGEGLAAGQEAASLTRARFGIGCSHVSLHIELTVFGKPLGN
jgi:hypothetical protein